MNSPSQRILALALASALALPFSGRLLDGDDHGPIDRRPASAGNPGAGAGPNAGSVPQRAASGQDH